MPPMRSFRLLPLFAAAALFAQPARHALTLDDLARFRDVRDPQCSPDGRWVAYTVTTTDVKEDKHDTDVWMVSIDGKQDLRLTSSPENETSPKWSPDGKYLAFLSSRPGKAKGNQVWLLARSGGEATQLTDVKGRLQSYEWSPDSRRLALVIGDPDPEADTAEGAKPKVPKPIVIDRYHFKQDGSGYVLSGRHSFIYMFDIATKKLERLTSGGKYDESSPVWSPDGARIAFMSNRAADPDRDIGGQVYVAESRAGSAETQLTPLAMNAGRGRVEWSPDGGWIVFLAGEADKKFAAYGMERMALVASDGSAPPALVKATADLDRGVSAPHFSTDGSSITFLVTDDRNVYPASVGVNGGAVKRLRNGPIALSSPTESHGCSAFLSGGDDKPTEVYMSDGSSLLQLTHQNDPLMSELDVAPTEEVSFRSKDGTEVHGLLTKPLHYSAGTKAPFLLRIHGGPNGQDAHSFSTERQFFAANGYAVMAVNYRGSAGRGQKFSRTIAADWGHFEVEDLEGGVEYAIHSGVADADRLGVGGWSYGAILTDYLIATDARFKAATSGAGTAFTVAFYGTDQYITQYDEEIGPPWKAFDTYIKISYPFLHADRIKTPTLFLGGERDFNVPVQGGQQMYQALRSLGIDTQLIIYPNETHGIQRPSYQRDRMERYLAWYNKYLKKSAASPTAAGPEAR
jgi:dipeptidyl aminopeptidase/acylaminoacyl peptidase